MKYKIIKNYIIVNKKLYNLNIHVIGLLHERKIISNKDYKDIMKKTKNDDSIIL